jgi:glycosyltransferase involved in cell wall biosynthesis
MRRLAVVASHPVQYQAPWFRALAQSCDLTVWYCHRQTAEEQGSAGFGHAFEWDVPLLDGYRFEWLNNVAARPGVSSYAGCDTPELRERLAEGRFDACIVNGWYLKSYLQAISACRALGIRVLVRGDSHLRGDRSALTRVVKYLPYRWLLRRIDAHLFVGLANYEYLRHYGVPESRLFFSPHFVENERFAAAASAAKQSGEAAALRARWRAGPHDTLFLFAGKLIEIKRAQDFVGALANAARLNPQIRGVIVGSGPDEAALRSLVDRERAPVAFAGFSNQSEMPSCYAAADCLVLPSRTESWGLVVNEAMATGIPAIVSDRVGSALDLIEEGVTGFSYAAWDVPALTGKLQAMHHLLTAGREPVRLAVSCRIARYSCANAVSGALYALDGGARTRAGAPVVVGNGNA